jgi:lysophospholipase L1-like esterase
MKMLKLSTVALLTLISTSVFASEKMVFPVEVKKENYTASIGKNGFISSIKVNGREFLSSAKGLPCGFYLCAGGIPPLKDFQKIDNETFEGQNQIAKINYKFKDNKIIVGISDIKKKGSLYIIINQAVKKVNYLKGANVPTIASTPAKAKCDKTRWFLDEVSLDINGISGIWGPWKKHQVCDTKLKPGKTVTVEIIPGKEVPSKNKVKPESGANKAISAESFTYADTTNPLQIPICMIGDSITWSGKGDHWRKNLLEILPRLAFIGTHTATLGYSHAGEGGNSTSRVIKRLNMIPDCPYYSLLIGTNDTGVKDEAKSQERAIRTAERIQKIVMGLLEKKGVKKVFLCSILPCFTNNPLRDKTNSLTNIILREKMKTVFPNDKVVWIEFEEPIRKIKDWEPKIKLHPTLEGYKIIAKIHADKIAKELALTDISKKPEPASGTGVRVRNLWDKKSETTIIPVIAGWYTVSFDVKKVSGDNPELKITGVDQSVKTALNQTIKLVKPEAGKRMTINFFTSYEGYGYSRSKLKLEPVNCEIDKILFEKSRPSKQASTYGEGIYIDNKTTPALGELVELYASVF